MRNNTMLNVAIGIYATVALLLYLFQSKNSGGITAGPYIALALLILLAFISPLLSFLVAVPIGVIVWFKYFPTALDTWNKLKNIKIGG